MIAVDSSAHIQCCMAIVLDNGSIIYKIFSEKSTAVLKPMCYCAGEATGLELCTSVLELLQWKADIQEEAELLAPLTQVLQQLLSSFTQNGQMPSSGPSPSVMDTSDDDDDNESSSDTEDDAEQPSLPRFVATNAWSLRHEQCHAASMVCIPLNVTAC